MSRVFRHAATWFALSSFVALALLISLPAHIVEALLPGGLPVGNLLAALALFLAPMTGVAYGAPGTRFRRVSLVATAVGLAWLPVSVLLSGNLANNFRGDDAAFMLWSRFTVVAGMLGLVTMIATLTAAIRDYRDRLYDGTT